MRPLLALCLLAVAIPSSAMVVRSPNPTEYGSENVIGAIYFTTNEPSGNYIISSAFGLDGKLYSQRAIATGGFGGRDLNPLGAGELFSSGVVEPSPLGVLAVANPGSDTISLFRISESDPSSLTPIGTPVWSRGEFPISVTFNKAGNVLCAFEYWCPQWHKVGYVFCCFNVDKAEGLTPISGTTRYLHLNQTSPLSGPVSGSASQVIFSEDNQLLIVAVKGLNGTTDAGYLAVWDVYENFTLSQDFNRVALPTGGFYPYSLMTISGQNAVLVTDPALGYEIFTNISGSSNTGEHRNIGVGSYARTIPHQLTTCWSAYSPISENYYLSDLADNRIAVISVDSDLNSTIVNYISLGNNFGPLDMATVSISGQGFLYVLSTTPQAVDVFSVDEPGKAVYIQRFNYTAFAKSAGITLRTNYLAGMSIFTWAESCFTAYITLISPSSLLHTHMMQHVRYHHPHCYHPLALGERRYANSNSDRRALLNIAMSELQSNAAYHLYPSHIVLPPYLMYGMETRTFWCAIYGSSIVFKISIHPDADVDDLKGKIQEKKRALRDHDTSKLVLWKLRVPEPMDPEDSLWQRIRKRGGVETFAEELKISRQKMSSVFPQSQLVEDHLHILVELPSNNSRSWLAVIHHKLWGEREFFGNIFRTADLTEHHFKELQDLLDKENPGRTSGLYVAKDVLVKKADFLREKSKPLEIDFGDGLVPRLVFDATQPPSSGVVDNDDVADDDNDAVADDDDDAVADNDNAMDIDPNHGYAGSHTDHLSEEAEAIFPYTIRYVDLTVLNLKTNLRVPLLMLFRNEWNTMIDIFNKRTHLEGIKGSAVFTGQPGIGKTCLLYSILILCMIRGQQFVFQDMHGKVFIIDDAGVNTPEDAWTVSDNEVLTLVDADVKCYEPEAYLLGDSKHRILLTSSPRVRKDRSWLKQFATMNAVFTMKPWSRKEFVVASLFLQGGDITLKRLQKVSYVSGNIPRSCFQAAASPAEVCLKKSEIRNAIQEIKDLFFVILHTQDSDKTNIIHRVFQVRPSNENRFWEERLAEPVSAWALSEMLNELRKQSMNEAYKFYCSIKGTPESAALRGRIFEIHLHRYLEISRTFTIRSLDDPSATPIHFTSGTNHLDFEDNCFSERLASSVRSNTSWYLRPRSPVFASFDSFLYLPGISHPGFSPLIALQVTTAAKHDINIKGLEKVQRALKRQDPNLSDLRPANNRKMIILFVVPDTLGETFGVQEITGEAKVKHWKTKTAQYVVTLSEEELFKFYAQTEMLNTT